MWGQATDRDGGGGVQVALRHLGGERRDEVDGRHAVAVDAVAVGRKGELARLHDADARKALVVDLL